jgi:hypothetical protein
MERKKGTVNHRNQFSGIGYGFHKVADLAVIRLLWGIVVNHSQVAGYFWV